MSMIFMTYQLETLLVLALYRLCICLPYYLLPFSYNLLPFFGAYFFIYFSFIFFVSGQLS